MDSWLTEASAQALQWREWAGANPILSVATFITAFALAEAAFVPVALFLTALGGYLYGVVVGAAASVIAATIGCLITYGWARKGLSGLVTRRFEVDDGRVRRMLEGTRREAFGYLLVCRLTPWAPGGLISLAAGAARLPLVPFVLATSIGIMPELIIYAALGQGMRPVIDRGGTVRLSDFTHPQTALALFALALSCLVGLLIRHMLQRRRRTQP